MRRIANFNGDRGHVEAQGPLYYYTFEWMMVHTEETGYVFDACIVLLPGFSMSIIDTKLIP